MVDIETFARMPQTPLSRRGLITLLAATTAASAVVGLCDGVVAPAQAAAAAWTPPPSYDRIVGLL